MSLSMTRPVLFALSLVPVLVGCTAREERRPVPASGPTVTVAAPPSAAPVNPLPSPATELTVGRVGLDGSALGLALGPSAAGQRLYPRAWRTEILQHPRAGSSHVGSLRLGASVSVAPQPVAGTGCEGGWYAVAPRGYVCSGRDATVDPNDPLVKAYAEYAPEETRKLPYVYGTVRRPGPLYARLPSQAELQEAEPDLSSRMEAWLSAGGEIGAGYGQKLWVTEGLVPPDPRTAWENRQSDPLPAWLVDSSRFAALRSALGAAPTQSVVLGRMQAKVGYSLLGTWLHEGRRYGLSTDLQILPTDRLRPIAGSDFHGFRIPQDVRLPFAIVRQPGARFWRFDEARKKLEEATPAPYRSAVELTGKQAFFRGRLHYETKDGLWISDRDGSRLDPARRMPAWGKNGDKWIDVNITKQSLMLYEGTRPVYATLVSTGEAGLEDPSNSTATKRGIFRIHTKHFTATMSSTEVGEEFELRDVPYVQYFEEGYALHGAYWHDRFGVPKSHGCINLAPEDARRIFFWTDPPLPLGWHEVRLPLKGTVIFVHP